MSEPSRQAPAATVPLVQNFNYNLPEVQQGAQPFDGQSQDQTADQQPMQRPGQQRAQQQYLQQYSNDSEQQNHNRQDADIPRRFVSQSPLSKLVQPGGQQRPANQLPANTMPSGRRPAGQAENNRDQARRNLSGQNRAAQNPLEQQQAGQRPVAQQSAGLRQGQPQKSQTGKYRSGPVNPGVVQKPCVTEFCGLKIPSLNGLWVAQDGEILGVNQNRYLWSDGESRYLTGYIKIQNEYLLASVDDHDKVMQFKYKLAGDHLLTMEPDGSIHEFIRMPVNQYRDDYMGYSSFLR